MRIVTSTVTREVIDAEITSAMYPGHVPARWALPLLDELDRVASGWQLVELDERELAALWLPAHDGERCHGDSMRLGEDERGATLEDSAAWLRRHADAYAAANPSCWGRISYAMERAPSRIVVSPINVGDRIKPGEEDDFNVRNISEIVATRTATTKLMSLLLGAVATISLIVGGIGIMNIMLVSVTERIREIGLRMAVGAGPGDVRRQFLAEAMLLSLGGGVLGIVIGVAGALLVGQFSELPVVLNGQVIGLAAGFSIATGLFFGYYPARKASQLDPIEALRSQ